MHKIKNKRRLALGLITNILSITCFVIAFFDEQKIRFIISAVLFLAFAVMNYYFAFRGVFFYQNNRVTEKFILEFV